MELIKTHLSLAATQRKYTMNTADTFFILQGLVYQHTKKLTIRVSKRAKFENCFILNTNIRNISLHIKDNLVFLHILNLFQPNTSILFLYINMFTVNTFTELQSFSDK